MRRSRALWIYALLTLPVTALYPQGIAGDWQGILKVGPEETRHLLQIVRDEGGQWNAKLFDVDQTHDWGLGIPVSSLTVKGSDLKFAIDRLDITYEGKMSADQTALVGTWTQGQPQPLRFQRATTATRWRDPSPHDIRFINTSKNVNLEVLDWGGPGLPGSIPVRFLAKDLAGGGPHTGVQTCQYGGDR